MIVVTGGAGFIGSNLVRALNAQGECDVVVVDDLTDGTKFRNLVDCEIADYLDKDSFAELIATPRGMPRPRAIVHMGACSSTTEWDGRFMMRENYTYSTRLAEYAAGQRVPFLYASSASVYGAGRRFAERREHEAPLNVYGYSKFLFDQYVRRRTHRSQVVGLRFFNVYGPREQHKGEQASVAWHFHRQLQDGDAIRLFEGSDGYGPGEQRRDFVYVDDVCAVVLWFLARPQLSGIYNVGSGRAQSFNEVAEAVRRWHGRGALSYIPFPEHLRGRYQSFTEACLGALREVGCDVAMRDVDAGVRSYLDWLAQHGHAGRL